MEKRGTLAEPMQGTSKDTKVDILKLTSLGTSKDTKVAVRVDIPCFSVIAKPKIQCEFECS